MSPLPAPLQPVRIQCTSRGSAVQSAQRTVPTARVRSPTGPCVTPFPAPSRLARNPSPPQGIAAPTVPKVQPSSRRSLQYVRFYYLLCLIILLLAYLYPYQAYSCIFNSPFINYKMEAIYWYTEHINLLNNKSYFRSNFSIYVSHNNTKSLNICNFFTEKNPKISFSRCYHKIIVMVHDFFYQRR